MRSLLTNKLPVIAVLSVLLLACNSENESTAPASSTSTVRSSNDDPLAGQSASSAGLMRALEHDESEVIVRVNGKAITRNDLDRHLQRKAAAAASGSGPKPEDSESAPGAKEKEATLQDLIKVELVYQAALDKGYDSRQDILAEAARRTKELFAEIFLIDILADAKFTDEDLRAEYDREIKDASYQYKIHLISRSSEEKASEVIRALNDGKTHFLTLVKEKSDDPAATEDGDLGWYALGKLYPSVAEAVKTMEVGDYSRKPIRGRSVWHVVFLEDKRELTPNAPDFEKVKELARLRLTNQLYQATVGRLKAEAVIEPVSAP